MEWHLIVGIVAGIVQAISVVPYIKDMLHGETRPNVVTWFLWMVIQIIIIAAQFSAGASWSVIILIVMTLNTMAVLLLCLKGYGYKKYGKIDFVCFLLAILAIVVWQITNEPVLAIVFSVVADFFALAPTIVKTYREPNSESAFPWFLNVVAGVLAVISTTKFDLANVLFPVYYIVTDSSLVILMLRGRRRLS